MSRYCRLRDAWEYCKRYAIGIQRFSRVEDLFVKCCTCGKVLPWYRTDAGHYIGRGMRGSSGAYFDERNVHAQCKQCNAFKGGAPREYEDYLRKKYDKEDGDDIINTLWVVHQTHNQPAPGIIGLYYKEKYEKLVRDLGF